MLTSHRLSTSNGGGPRSASAGTRRSDSGTAVVDAQTTRPLRSVSTKRPAGYWSSIKWRQYHRNRLAVVAAYGGVCQLCGDSRYEVLSFDHVGGWRNQGLSARPKGGEAFVRRLRAGLPRLAPGVRLLCYNCNCTLGFLGLGPADYPGLAWWRRETAIRPHPVKFSEADVALMRSMRLAGSTTTAIAARFRADASHVSRVCRGKARQSKPESS